MRKTFFIKFTVFILTTAAGIVFTALVFRFVMSYAYPTSEEYKRICFENPLKLDYKLLITGNSKIAYGINPDLLDIKSFNFASRGEALPMTFAKLRYLEKNNKINFNYLIIGLDFFTFSWREVNEAYFMPYLPEDGPTPDVYDLSGLTLNEKLNMYITDNYTARWRIFFETVIKLARGINPVVLYFRENGQIVQERPSRKLLSVDRDCYIDSIAYYYFNRVLSFANEHKLKTVLVIPPTGTGEHYLYKGDPHRDFHTFLDTVSAKYGMTEILDYSDSTMFADTDFVDVEGHLNGKGADKFTALLNRDLMRIIGERKAEE